MEVEMKEGRREKAHWFVGKRGQMPPFSTLGGQRKEARHSAHQESFSREDSNTEDMAESEL